MRSEKKVNILVLNCGSSSLKYKIISMPGNENLVCGEVERVGIKTQGVAVIRHTVFGKTQTIDVQLSDHAAALKKILELIRADGIKNKAVTFDIFAHRYVHPGHLFTRTTRIDKNALTKLKETLPFAPLHNPIVYNLIDFCHREYKKIAQFAVFDTAFHKTIPPEFSTYALPLKIIKKYGIQKIGFHGISHRFVMEEACKYLDRDVSGQKIISCHLGTGGSSVCAINAGKSINSSMGFTPLEGLMMNTRCGDVDPGVVFYIMFKEGFTPQETEKILNSKSGILGVFDSSSDLRDVVKGIDKDSKAKTVFNMYVRRVRSYIAFFALILKKADILLFTDSLGVGVAQLRESICSNMEFLGIQFDQQKNSRYKNGISMISRSSSETKILVVPTDEEAMIARETYKEFLRQ